MGDETQRPEAPPGLAGEEDPPASPSPSLPAEPDEWDEALARWDEHFDGMSLPAGADASPSAALAPAETVSLSAEELVGPDFPPLLPQPVVEPATVVTAPEAGMVPLPAANEADTSDVLIIPDLAELETGAARGPIEPPSRGPRGVIGDTDLASEPLPLRSPPGSAVGHEAPQGRSLRAEDGLPELSGLFSVEALGRPALWRTTAAAGAPLDPFTMDLPAEAPAALALPASGDLPGGPEALAAAVPERAEPILRSRAQLREQMALYREELRAGAASAGQVAPVAEVPLLISAARAAERLDPSEALALYDEALRADAGCVAALRGRFRLLVASRRPEAAGAALRSLHDRLPPDERTGYAFVGRVLAWVHPGSLAADEVLGDEAEEPLSSAVRGLSRAIRARAPARAASGVEALADEIGQGDGGGVASAMRTFAARLREIAGASEERAPEAPAQSRSVAALARLRQATRAVHVQPPSLEALNAVSEPLRSGLLRWAAALARERGEPVEAAQLDRALLEGNEGLLLERLGAFDPSTATDETLARATALDEALPPGPVRTLLRHKLAAAHLGRGRPEPALALVRVALAESPEAVPLALCAEALAFAAVAPALRREALRLWADFDPVRRPFALSRLLDDAGLDDDRRSSLQGELLETAPADPTLFEAAAGHAAGGRLEAAATLLEAAARDLGGANAAAEASVAGALTARAAELRAAAQPQNAVARLLAATGDRPRGAAALATGLLAAEGDPRALAELFQAAAVGSQSPWRRLEAVAWLLQTGANREALQMLLGQISLPPAPGTELLLQRLVRIYGDAPTRIRLFERLAATAGERRRAELFLRRAEALELSGDLALAAELYRELLAGPLAIDADLALRRVLWATRDHDALMGLLRDEIDARLGAGQVGAAAQRLIEKALVLLDLRDEPNQAAAALEEALAHDPHRTDARLMLLLLRAAAADFQPLVPLLGAIARFDVPSIAPAIIYVGALLARNRGTPDEARALVEGYASEPKGGALPLALARLGLDLIIEQTPMGERAARIIEALAERLSSAEAGDPRLAAVLAARAAEIFYKLGAPEPAEALLRRACRADEPERLVPVAYLERTLGARQAWAESLASLEAEASLLRRPENRAAALLHAAVIAEDRLGDGPKAIELLRGALTAEPTHEEAWRRLRRLLEGESDLEGVAALLSQRAEALADHPHAETLRLERAELLAGPLGDRARAKDELRALLQAKPQHGSALGRLAALELEDGAHAIGAELLIRQARFERDPEALTTIFLKIGRIHLRRLADPKLATGAYERVLQLSPSHVEALEALSDLYTRQGEANKALAVTERLTELEREPSKRLGLLLRQAALWERSGEPRRSGALLKRAAEEAPRSLQAVGELARFYERVKEPQARSVLLDRSIGLLREDLRGERRDLGALRALVPLLRWRARNACSAAAAQLLAVLSEEPAERSEAAAWAAPPSGGRRLAPLVNPELDERLRPGTVPLGLLNVLRRIGPPLSKTHRPDLRRLQVGRADRASPGSGLRVAFEGIAAELGLRGVDLYVSAADPRLLAVEPGDTPAVVVGRAIAELRPEALRFVAAYALRLLETHFALLVREGPAELGALLTALIRQFSPQYEHPDVPLAAAEAMAARVTKAVSSRALRVELAPFVAEITARHPLETLHLGLRESAARVGLLACGDLSGSLEALALVAGHPLTLEAAFATPLAAALVDFALSDDHEELVAALDAVS